MQKLKKRKMMKDDERCKERCKDIEKVTKEWKEWSRRGGGLKEEGEGKAPGTARKAREGRDRVGERMGKGFGKGRECKREKEG